MFLGASSSAKSIQLVPHVMPADIKPPEKKGGGRKGIIKLLQKGSTIAVRSMTDGILYLLSTY